jgi:ABC-three component (ABC-3C) system Middle Component 6
MHLLGVKYLKIQKVMTMLLPDNIHPENSVYYNGSFVLQVLQKNNKLEMLELYNKVKIIKDMSFPVFILCLDWLYLINVAELKREKVELCS